MRRFVFVLLFLLLTIPPALGEPRALTYGVEPTFSHDGRMIAYASLEGGYRDIYVVDDLGNKKRLTTDVYWDGQPAFTPDDEAVVFVSDRSGNRELWQIDIGGENLKQLTKGEGWKSYPSVSSTDRIAFTSGRYPRLDIYILEGGAVIRLTHIEDEIYSPVWSPDGDRIAFVNGEDLMVIDGDGTGLRRIASGVYFRGLSWSKKGKILYLERNLGYDLWRIDTEDPEKRELIYAGVTDSWEVNPAVSSTGEIAFSTDKDGFYTIHVIDIDIPPAQVEAPPAPVAVPALVPAANPAPAENVLEPLQPSSGPSEERSEERSKDASEKRLKDEIELPESPEYSKDEIVVPEPSMPADDEILLPDLSLPEEREIIIEEGYQEFVLLAALALFVFLIKSLKSRRPIYRL